ncbi:MAG: hypothetical protein J7501_11795, partial [Bdellovibrio sp.]|nr:hypothetical protein [Bdellovibrio sp.]
IISWSRIAKIYEAIKKDPTNPAWVKLNLLARGIVSDDQKRIVNGVFYGVKRQSVPMVLEIDRKATACLQVETCTNPELTDAEASFLSSHTLLNYEIRGFKNPKATDEQKRQNFERFATRVHFLADKYGMHKINILKVTDKVLTVPMDLSVLGDDGAALFMEYIEKTWNIDSEYSIKIEAVKDGSPAFKLKVDNVIGGRANVSRNELYMQLYNFGGIKTATHEFGHELGFSDNYYTSWDTDTCAYTTEGNRGEIMSNSAQGAVLPRHWETLKKTYWDDQTQQAPK